MIGRIPGAILLAGMAAAAARTQPAAPGAQVLTCHADARRRRAAPGRLYVAADNNILAFDC